MSGFTYVFIGFLVVLAIVIIRKGVKIVPQAKVMIIERLGKYHKTLQSGFNIINPILDEPRKMNNPSPSPKCYKPVANCPFLLI